MTENPDGFPDLSPEEIKRLAELPTDDEGNVKMTTSDIQEVEAYANALGGARPGSSGAVSARGQRYAAMHRQKKAKAFTFGSLIERLLPPEQSHGQENEVAESLLEVTSARLDDIGMLDTDALECLTALTHLYVERNCIRSFDGLAFMMHLTTLVAHHNQLDDISPIADLPKLVYLDVGYNQLESLDVDDMLPTTLKALVLKGNPVAPNYDDGEELDMEYLESYQEAIKARCPMLRSLDGSDVGNKTLLEMTTDIEKEQTSTEQDAEKNDGMTTNICDADFILPDEDEGQDDSGLEDARIDDGDASDDDGDAAASGKKPASKKPKARYQDANVAKNTSSIEVEPGVASDVGRIRDGLIARYEKKLKEKNQCLDKAVTVEQMEGDRGEDDDETVQEVMITQRELRQELRAANSHHSNLANSALEKQWTNSANELQVERERIAKRREEMENTRKAPSAAYLRALETLKKQSGSSDLDKYRKPRD